MWQEARNADSRSSDQINKAIMESDQEITIMEYQKNLWILKNKGFTLLFIEHSKFDFNERLLGLFL